MVPIMSWRLMQLPSSLSIFSVRADETGDGDRTAIGEEFRHFGDAADVFVSVFLAESKVLIQSETDVVAVEPVGGEAAVQEV